MTLTVTPLSAKAVTIVGLSLRISQGSTVDGAPWFGISGVNLTGPNSGYPIQVSSGATFSVSVILVNYDSYNHSLYSVSLDRPLLVRSTVPALPAPVDAGEDVLLVFWVEVVAPSGTTVFGVGSINALG